LIEPGIGQWIGALIGSPAGFAYRALARHFRPAAAPGADIEGVDLAGALPPETVAAVKKAWDDRPSESGYTDPNDCILSIVGPAFAGTMVGAGRERGRCGFIGLSCF
jgi:hypothetical protein